MSGAGDWLEDGGCAKQRARPRVRQAAIARAGRTLSEIGKGG